MHPSFSGLLVIWAYFPNTTLPPVVTIPSSETLTSITVPLVMTPSCVYMGDWGFFLTPRICSWKVALRSANEHGQQGLLKETLGYARCVTLAFLYRSAMGRTKRSILTGFRVKPSPTKVAFVTMRFHDLLLLFPVFITLNISSSAMPRTLGRGTAYLAALSLRFCLMALDSALASFWPSRSRRYVGRAPSGTVDESACLTLRSSCALSVFLS